MTATVTRVPEIEDVLRRADARLADRCGDEPLPPDHIATFARAVEPLLAGRPPASAADLAELEQLRQRLADADRQLEDATAEIQRLTAELPALEELEARADKFSQQRDAEAAEAARLAGLLEEATRREAALVAEHTAALADVEARAEVYRQERTRHEAARSEEQAATITRLTTEVEMLRGQLHAANTGAAELADLLDAERLVAERQHMHSYPWPDPAQAPGPCSCGKPHPWAELAAAELVGPEEPPETGPWDTALRDRIRAELEGWPA
ncbi:hypothetical protein [Amycolatopsis sp. YIM 10]|uniref:hypothetical protein n=1 Tax=Amycolatopsis sp. YIM 10 TaxID=2653857 RepID=UPI0012908559|nr:hypothetical protein [Amycolatopsis sp. YIM 10]QFU87848.1 hypothetical protein YIM_13310 [Amycolatopsis sp. YIM 10]QFU94839.1 hypothetical protein YIM_48570 [Amycolatopsis sp. YIM 10]